MADRTTLRARVDRKRIDPSQEQELRYWSHELRCSTDELRAAVEAVGTSVEKVRAYVEQRAR